MQSREPERPAPLAVAIPAATPTIARFSLADRFDRRSRRSRQGKKHYGCSNRTILLSDHVRNDMNTMHARYDEV
jgi:hypothetical protein